MLYNGLTHKADAKLSLIPKKCDDIKVFGEPMIDCADENITRVSLTDRFQYGHEKFDLPLACPQPLWFLDCNLVHNTFIHN